MTERDADRTARPQQAAQSGRTKPDTEASEPTFVVRDKRRKPSPRPRSDSATDASAGASGEGDVPEKMKGSTTEQRDTARRSTEATTKRDDATKHEAPPKTAKSDTAGGFAAEAAALRTELDDRTRDLQRLTAEYANYRRRVERDRALVAEQATASVLAELLGVLDDLDRARDHGDLVGPFGAVAEQLVSVLTKLGLEPFGEPGDEFDPKRHEAVAHSLSSEVSEPTCVRVFRRGYRFGERLLRPALVAVADPSGDEPAEPASGTGRAEPASGARRGQAEQPETDQPAADGETDEATVVEGEVVEVHGDVIEVEAERDDAAAAADAEADADSGGQPAATTEEQAGSRTPEKAD